MCWKKIFYIIILLFIVDYQNKKEGFSSPNLKQKSNDVLKQKNIFKPGVKYIDVKNKIPWIDPVVYNDVYKLSLKEDLTISNLENTLYNIIQ